MNALGRFLLLILLMGQAAVAQQTATSLPEATQAVGPGSPLPPQPEPPPPMDVSGSVKNALSLAETIRPLANDLLILLGGISFVYAAYQLQFGGSEILISAILRVVIAAALLNSMSDTIPILFDARDSLQNSIGVNAFQIFNAWGALTLAVTGTAIITGPIGIGIAITYLFQVATIFILKAMTILLPSFLVAVAPFSIVCLSFQKTSGIFTAWLKTLIVILLIPVIWDVMLHVGTNLVAPENIVHGILATIIFIASLSSIYLAAPAIAFYIVNSAGGPLAAAFPNPMGMVSSLASSWLSNDAGKNQAAGVAGKVSGAIGGTLPTLAGHIGSYFGGTPAASGGSTPSSYEQRVAAAQRFHQTFQPKQTKSS